MFSLLEGDGVIENIYHLLWTKDSIFGTEPYVMIPDTILYKYQKPCYWYFSSKKDNKLKKKSSMRLTNEHIAEVFTKKLSPSGIVACYIYGKNSLISKYETDNQKIYQNPFYIKKEIDTSKEVIHVIEYFDLNKFHDFLNKKVTYDDGILQKFEDPKGDYNFTVRLTWSPKICIFEKKTCLKRLYDNRYDVYERAVTYDGEEFQVKTEPIKGTFLPDRIEKIANSMVSHVSNITLERIKIIRMILNFKITKDDNIVFMWCSSLRIENNSEKKKEIPETIKEFDINKIKLNAPDDVNLFKFSNTGKPIKPLKDSICLNCDLNVESYRLYEISFAILIESHDNRKRDMKFFKNFEKINVTSSGVEVVPFVENKTHSEAIDKTKKKNLKNFLIPKVIYSIYPKMKYEDYQSLKGDAIFHTKTASVCEICFLNLTRYCDFSKSNSENVLRFLRPKDINIESKFMNIVRNNSGKTFFTQNKKINKHSDNESNYKNIVKNMLQTVNSNIFDKNYPKQIPYNTIYPPINNNKFFSVERRPFENQLKDPDKTDLESHRNSIHTAPKFKK